MLHVDFLSRNHIDNVENGVGRSPDTLIHPFPSNVMKPIDTTAPTKLSNAMVRPHGRKRSVNKNSHPKTVIHKQVLATSVSSEWLLAEQQKDSFISDIISKLNSNEIDDELRDTYEIRSGILHRKIQRNSRSLFAHCSTFFAMVYCRKLSQFYFPPWFRKNPRNFVQFLLVRTYGQICQKICRKLCYL